MVAGASGMPGFRSFWNALWQELLDAGSQELLDAGSQELLDAGSQELLDAWPQELLECIVAGASGCLALGASGMHCGRSFWMPGSIHLILILSIRACLPLVKLCIKC